MEIAWLGIQKPLSWQGLCKAVGTPRFIHGFNST